MTDYRLYGIGHDDGFIHAQLIVGKRDRLEKIELTRREAWRLLNALGQALEVTE